jgi:teichuronic acid biosynthesis glycosyltransferase TuaG
MVVKMATQNSKFSIVMPAYNAEKTVSESIESVIRQSYQDWELIIVDDKSTDNTYSAAAAVSNTDSRIKVVRLSRNGGVARARNHAMELASGRYIAFLDSDDTWTEDKLSLQYDAFNSGAKIVFGSYRRIFNDNTYQTVRAKSDVDENIFKYYNPIGNLTGAYDRTIGMVPQKDIRHEDYMMWYELVCRSKRAVGLSAILGNYRVNSASLSGNKIKAAKWHWDVLRNGMNISAVHASIYFLGYALNTASIRMSQREKLVNSDAIR